MYQGQGLVKRLEKGEPTTCLIQSARLEEVLYMAGTRRGYGFNILDARGGPVHQFAYANKDEAERAREAALKMIGNAVS
jgi:hypothetical protein